MEEVNLVIEMAQESMEHSIDHLQKELIKLKAGKASPDLLHGLMVQYYGAPTPLHQVANVSVADARTIVVQPWERSMLGPIEKSVFEANLGITPQNDGEVIRLVIPPLTEERRKDLVKRAKSLGEDAKVSIRSARREAMEDVKKAIKNGFPEDSGKKREHDIQTMTDSFSQKIDQLIEKKEKDILTI